MVFQFGIINNQSERGEKDMPFDAKNFGDSYYTPEWCYESLPIDWTNYKTAYDPSMGDGRMFLFLEEQGISVDGGDTIYDETESFYNWNGKADLIITNPPFSKASDFIEYAMPRCKTLILLLRLNFLASQKRYPLFKENKPDALFVLSKRPSFNGKGTDNADYAWFVWQNEEKHIEAGIHHILP